MGITSPHLPRLFLCSRHFVSFYRFTTSALPPPWSKSFAVFIWSICLPYLAPNIPNQPLLKVISCIQLSSCSILINISSCCLLTPRPLSRFQKSKAVTFSITRISYQPSETNWVQFTKTLVLSKLSVLNFFSSFESSFRIQDFNPDHLRILWRNKYSSDILSMGMQNIHTVCTYYT